MGSKKPCENNELIWRWHQFFYLAVAPSTALPNPRHPDPSIPASTGPDRMRNSGDYAAISRIGSFSRKAMRLMMFKSPMWITPLPPRRKLLWRKVHMGQFSMEIICLAGSILRGNQHLDKTKQQSVQEFRTAISLFMNILQCC